ncbi:MAG: hypothetical protein AAF677_03365 [Pseudomonadota bacterium]
MLAVAVVGAVAAAVAAAVVGARRRARRIALAAGAVALSVGAAQACAFHPGEAVEAADRGIALARLPAGITKGWVRCGAETPRPMVVWTVAFEGGDYVGARDGPLFRPLPANPLVDIAGVGLAHDAAFSLFMWADQAEVGTAPEKGPDRRPPHRVFGTLCPRAAADRLDCSVGAHRLKARVDVGDRDGDGVLDTARHEVSIVTPGRVQVLLFAVPHSPSAEGTVVHWIEAMEIAGIL